MEKLLFFIPTVIIVAFLLWLVRSPEERPEYYEKSKCEPIREVIEKYEPR